MIELLLQAERALAVGLLDQAEQLYRQAIERDPRNGIAVVGLARVALERGEERTAWELASRALGIDPENAAAQRLAARLAEVIAWRVETPPDATGSGAQGEAPPGTLESQAQAAAATTIQAQGTTTAATTGPTSAAPARRGLIDRLLRRR